MTSTQRNDNPFALCLMGPTASGKTEAALELARQLPCEIISVDSAMVYRGLDIGTAKPSPEVLSRVPHHLIDILDPAERYSAGRFLNDALSAMREIWAAGQVPLLVGGTMLYFRLLQQGLARLPAADPVLRSQIERRAQRLGWAALHRDLAAVDPAAAQRIHPNDPQRIQRALEVFELTGQPISALQRKTEAGTLQMAKIALVPSERLVLHQTIELRFNTMIAKGFLEEVKALYDRGDLYPQLPSIRSVGYRQLWDHIAGTVTRENASQRALAATRQLAKRQMTWLRREEALHWIDASGTRWRAQLLKYATGKLAERGFALC